MPSPVASSPPVAPRAPAPADVRADPRHLLRHGLQVVVANTAIAGVIVLMHGGSWMATLVYSQCIGLSCWALIETGRFVLPLDDDGAWPRGWRTPALLAVACGAGYIIGRSLADAFFGKSSWAALLSSPRDLAGDLAFTAVFGAIVIGWFFTRARSQSHAARLAAVRHEATLAHLALLQSQLEPHMLFNTLANLRALIALDPPRAQEMLDRLIGFLRATLVASRSGPQPLADEFARIEDYLALMQVRMGPRLHVKLALPADLAQTSVPPLLLQPLVENAIKHGLEPRRGPGLLEVGAVRDGQVLVLSVEDGEARAPASPVPTGIPSQAKEHAATATTCAVSGARSCPARELPELRESQGATPGTGFGLVQVRERLRRLHGDAAALTLAPGSRDGWRAEIRVPLEWTLHDSKGLP